MLVALPGIPSVVLYGYTEDEVRRKAQRHRQRYGWVNPREAAGS